MVRQSGTFGHGLIGDSRLNRLFVFVNSDYTGPCPCCSSQTVAMFGLAWSIKPVGNSFWLATWSLTGRYRGKNRRPI